MSKVQPVEFEFDFSSDIDTAYTATYPLVIFDGETWEVIIFNEMNGMVVIGQSTMDADEMLDVEIMVVAKDDLALTGKAVVRDASSHGPTPQLTSAHEE